MDTKIKCYIWDIDGTIAHRTNRTPYDYTTVKDDIPDPKMRHLYQALRAGSTAIHVFVTGRDESCRKDTEEWLENHGFNYEALYMRPLGNKDLDTNIKLAVYNEHIAEKYDVVCVFEDRGRCVEMYRKHLGLKVCQVDEGKF